MNNIKTKNINDFDNMFNKNIRLLKPSKKNINLNFIDTNKQKNIYKKKLGIYMMMNMKMKKI
jgi:hypothetical protein